MPATYTIGQVLPNGATVIADTFVTQPDGSTTETMDAQYPSGAVDHTVIQIPGPGTPSANEQALHQKATNALVDNVTFLAIGAPTNAQAVAQVQALTRQMNALIRQVLGRFDTTTGT